MLSGLPWLARMIDKVSGIADGALEGYEFPCGMDRELLDHLKISSSDFSRIVRSSPKTEDDTGFPGSRDEVVLRLLLRPEQSAAESNDPKDKLFSSIFLVRNSRLLNQLENEESR